MKRTYIWIIALALLFTLSTVVGCSQDAPPPPPVSDNGEEVIDFRPVTLRWAEQTPPVGMRAEVVQWMAEEIEDRTDGRVKIELHWDSTLLNREEMLRGVMTGSADMGSTNVAFHPSALYTWGVFNTFLTGPEDLGKQLELKARIVEEIPAFNAELERWNQRWITQFAYQSGMLGSRDPLTSLDQLKGKSMRAPSIWLLAMLEAAGSTPVSMPWSEVYTALDRGTIDGVYTSVDSFERYNVDEVAKHYLWGTQLWMPQPFLITMNNDTWNGLLERDQEVISQIGIEAQQMGIEMNQVDMSRGIKSMEDRSGAIITTISDGDLQAWLNHPDVAGLPDRWAAEAEEKGLPGLQIVERIREIMQDMQ